jgi:cytochrome c oxidase cbb3-type subunit 4
MDINFLHSIWTVVMFVVFIGIIVWAWSGKRKTSFEEAARMPLDDKEEMLPVSATGEKKHG